MYDMRIQNPLGLYWLYVAEKRWLREMVHPFGEGVNLILEDSSGCTTFVFFLRIVFEVHPAVLLIKWRSTMNHEYLEFLE
jgi:hypothetical protein